MVLSTTATPLAVPQENKQTIQTKTVLRNLIIYRPLSAVLVGLFGRFNLRWRAARLTRSGPPARPRVAEDRRLWLVLFWLSLPSYNKQEKQKTKNSKPVKQDLSPGPQPSSSPLLRPLFPKAARQLQ